MRVLAGLVGVFLTAVNGLALLHFKGGLYIGPDVVFFVIGLLSLAYAVTGWTPPLFGRRVFSGASGSEVALRVLATLLAGFSALVAYTALFLGGSWPLCVLFGVCAVLLALFALTGWPASLLRRKAGPSDRAANQ